MKRLLLGFAMSVILIISGCSTSTLNQSNTESRKKTQIESQEPQKSTNVLQREKNKKIEVKVEGEVDYRDAQLTVSDSLGYSFYLLDNFKFSAEEPGKDIIFSKYDGDFFVRIEKLDNKINLEEFRQSQKKSYSSMGTVTDIDPSTLFADKFKDSKFSFIVNIPTKQSVKTQTTIVYVVKNFGGNLYSFTFHMPLKEAAEGITPSLWAMVSTIEVN